MERGATEVYTENCKREGKSEESKAFVDLGDCSEMQMRAMRKPARLAKASVGGSQSIEAVRKSCLVERQDDVYVTRKWLRNQYFSCCQLKDLRTPSSVVSRRRRRHSSSMSRGAKASP